MLHQINRNISFSHELKLMVESSSQKPTKPRVELVPFRGLELLAMSFSSWHRNGSEPAFIKWFNGKIPALYCLSLIIFMALSSSAFSVHADIANNLSAEIEGPNVSQPNIFPESEWFVPTDITNNLRAEIEVPNISQPNTEEQNQQCRIVFFHIVKQIDDRLMIGFPLGENIYSPLKLQPIISLNSEPLIGIPLYSNTCQLAPLLNEEKEQHIQEQEYFLLMNNFFE